MRKTRRQGASLSWSVCPSHAELAEGCLRVHCCSPPGFLVQSRERVLSPLPPPGLTARCQGVWGFPFGHCRTRHGGPPYPNDLPVGVAPQGQGNGQPKPPSAFSHTKHGPARPSFRSTGLRGCVSPDSMKYRSLWSPGGQRRSWRPGRPELVEGHPLRPPGLSAVQPENCVGSHRP